MRKKKKKEIDGGEYKNSQNQIVDIQDGFRRLLNTTPAARSEEKSLNRKQEQLKAKLDSGEIDVTEFKELSDILHNDFLKPTMDILVSRTRAYLQNKDYLRREIHNMKRFKPVRSDALAANAWLNNQLLSFQVTGDQVRLSEEKGEISKPTMRRRLPLFLVEAMNASISFNVSDLFYDIRLGLSDLVHQYMTLLGCQNYLAVYNAIKDEDEIAQLRGMQNEFVECFISFGREVDSRSRSILKESNFPSENVSNNLRPFDFASIIYAKKEAGKRQLLFGVPFTYNMLMEGHHSIHRSKGRLDTMTDSDVACLKQAFDSFALIIKNEKRDVAIEDIKLPIGTSQGLLLKSSQDGFFFRGASKYLLAMLASRSDTYDSLLEALFRVGDEFVKRGYDDPCLHAFLGLRRMQMSEAKKEPYFLEILLEFIIWVIKNQGRIRAIFPFVESLKLWVKWLVEPVKKVIFHNPGIFCVEPQEVERCQALCADRAVQSKKLMDHYLKTGEWLPNYDLSGYDTSTCRFLNDLYDGAMIKIVGKRLWGDAHNKSGVFFLDNVYHFDGETAADATVLFDDVEGRSSLSGEADITVKNNFIHGCLQLAFLGQRNKWNVTQFNQAARRMILGSGSMPNYPLYDCHIHGDDVVSYIDGDPQTYIDLATFMKRCGISSGFEDGPIYLKKIPLSSANKTFGNIGASLYKNRLGEYRQDNFITLTLSLIDNIESEVYHPLLDLDDLLLARQSNELRICQFFWSKLVQSDTSNILKTYTIERKNASAIHNVRIGVSKFLSRVTDNDDPRSVRIRKALVNNLYKSDAKAQTSRAIILDMIGKSNQDEDVDVISDSYREYGEDITNTELASVFNTYSLNSAMDDIPEFPPYLLEIRDLSRDSLIDLVVRVQAYILDNNGNPPSKEIFESLVKDK